LPVRAAGHWEAKLDARISQLDKCTSLALIALGRILDGSDERVTPRNIICAARIVAALREPTTRNRDSSRLRLFEPTEKPTSLVELVDEAERYARSRDIPA
jgi:hypothetical protein